MTTDRTQKTERKEPVSFSLGRVGATPGVLSAISPADLMLALSRHARGDWGNVPKADWEENDLSVKEGFRILSAYQTDNGTKFWVITEADRSSTTVLLPTEY